MQFKDIVGHREETARLRAMVDDGKLPHAIMLHGPSGTGKTNVARALVQYICCTDRRDGDSCGRCPACIQTAKLNNPDIHYIYPIVKNKAHDRGLSEEYLEEWKEFIKSHPYMPFERWLEALDAGNSQPIIYKNESEEILRISSLSAYGNGYKIFFIWLPEKMNLDASNRLLKVIEEPHPDTLFIMVSNNPDALLPTIRSRVQGVAFRRLPQEDITDFLYSSGRSYEEAAALSRIARGNMNVGASLAEHDGELDEFRNAFMGVMRAAYARKMTELMDFSESFAGFGREKSMRLLDYFARMIRESFVSNLKCEALNSMTADEESFVDKFGPFVNAANVEEISAEIDRAREDISRNANQKIVWFDFLVQLTRLIRTKGIPKS